VIATYLYRFFLAPLCAFCALSAVDRTHDDHPLAAQHVDAKPELVAQVGHTGFVKAVAFSHDGRLVATGSDDKSVKIWELASGRELRSLRGSTGGVKSLAFGPDDRWLLSGSADNTARIWDLASGQQTKTIDLAPGIQTNAVLLSPDGKTLLSASFENEICIWDVATARQIAVLSGHTSAVMALALSRDGHTLVSASLDKTLKVWDLMTRRERFTLSGHTGEVLSVAVSPDGKYAASGGRDDQVRIWDLAAGEQIRIMQAGNNVQALAFNSDGRRLATGGFGHPVKVWDLASGATLLQSFTAYSMPLAFSADDQWLTTGEYLDVVLWKIQGTGVVDQRTLSGKSDAVKTVAVSSDGRWLATGSQSVDVWDTTGGSKTRQFRDPDSVMGALALSSDGAVVASGGSNKVVTLREVSTGHVLKTFTGHSADVTGLAFSPQNDLLASASNDQTLKIWSLQSKTELHSLSGHSANINCVAFSPDGHWLASGSTDSTARIWDVPSGSLAFTLTHPSTVLAVAFSADSHLLATGDLDNKIRLWDVSSGANLRTFVASSNVLSLAFSPDGKLLAWGTADFTISVLDLSGGGLRKLSGHSDAVNSLTFSSGSDWLFSGSSDGTMRTWNVETGAEAASLMAVKNSKDWLVVTPDGLFDGSPAAWSQVLWRFSGNTFDVAPAEIFFNEYFHPGLLADILSGKQPAAASEIAAKDRRQPQITLTSADVRTNDANTASRLLSVKIAVTAAPGDAVHAKPGQVRDVRLFRNGSLVKLWPGEVPLDQHGAAVLDASVSILAGENRLTAYAFNDDNVKSADATLAVKGASALKRKGTAYILVIGIDHYDNSNFDLRFAVADAEDFAQELQHAQTLQGSYERVEVIALLNDQAKRANILAALARLAGQDDHGGPLPPDSEVGKLARAEPEDTVFIFYAGHGTAAGDRFYLIPRDLGYKGARKAAAAAAMNTIISHSISDQDLERSLEQVDAGRIVLVIDACNSGQALVSKEKRRGPMNSKGLAQLAYEKGMYVLTAAQSFQAALEVAQLGHGLLTYALVDEGLKQGAADFSPKDGEIELREWLDFATERVPELERLKIDEAQQAGRSITFTDEKQSRGDPHTFGLQHPRVFYRREADATQIIIAKP